MDIIKVFYDLETTGTDERKHSIHQISGIVEVNEEVVELFDIKTRPHPKAQIESGALAVSGKTVDDIMNYQDMKEAYKEYKSIILKYIDPYDKFQKAWNIGFNNRGFDDKFLRAWFRQNGDDFIGSLFWTDTLDVMVLASEYLIHRRSKMPSFKLKRVALELGILVDPSRLHDAQYDIYLTREIYRIVTGRQIEI